MNYTIITDEQALLDFINWLPDLKDNETYYCSLFARKKYCKEEIATNDKTQLKRFTSNKERLLEKIKQLEVAVGAYKLKEIDDPQESLALYINPNPRDMKKATFMVAQQCLNLIQGDANNFNIHAEALSCIQKSKSKSHFVDFDIDFKAIDLNLLDGVLEKDMYHILETRGGYHILVDTKKAPKTDWYKQIGDLYEIDQVGDNLIPVAGTFQGGFTPRFV